MQLRWRLRMLHRMAGEAYELVFADDLSPYYEDIAYHFEQAELIDRALPYLRLAADRAKRDYRNETALQLYRRLLTHLPPRSQERSEIYTACGEILHSIGVYGEAMDSYRQAIALLGAAEEPEGRVIADIHRRMGSILVDEGAYGRALAELTRAESWLDETPSVERARIDLLRAGILYRQGKVEQALTWAQLGLERATQVGGEAERAHGLRLLGTIHTGLGDLQSAEQDYLASLDLCREMGDLRQQSMAANSLGAVYYYLGDWEQAERYYRQSLIVAEQIGFVDQQATVSNNLGELYLMQGRFDDAEERFQACLKTWRRTGFLLGVALSWRNLAQIAANRGQWEQASSCLEESLLALDELDSRSWVRAEVYRLLAEVELARGNQDAAWERGHHALDIVTEQNIKLVASNVQRTLGRLYRSDGQWEQAETALQESVSLAQELGLRYEEGKAWHELALLYQARTPPDAGLMQDALVRARTIFSELNARWDLDQLDAMIEHNPDSSATNSR
jgi:tetratricopeptide (TPR) repeat protein